MGFDQDAVDVAVRARLPVTEEIERGETSLLRAGDPAARWATGSSACSCCSATSPTSAVATGMLLSKDATIREIHHRVKNNLQTIAALLRLQGRRLQSPEAQAAIEESERRIRSIAIVHETLSRDAGDVVRFDDIVQPLVRVVAETVTGPTATCGFAVEGDAGDAAGRSRHAVGGRAQRADAERGRPRLRVATGAPRAPCCVQLARDDGRARGRRGRRRRRACRPGFTVEQSGGLGLSIVQTLVTSELGGTIELRTRRRDRACTSRCPLPTAANAPLEPRRRSVSRRGPLRRRPWPRLR